MKIKGLDVPLSVVMVTGAEVDDPDAVGATIVQVPWSGQSIPAAWAPKWALI